MFLIFEKEIVVFGSENSSCFFVVFCESLYGVYGEYLFYFFLDN